MRAPSSFPRVAPLSVLREPLTLLTGRETLRPPFHDVLVTISGAVPSGLEPAADTSLESSPPRLCPLVVPSSLPEERAP